MLAITHAGNRKSGDTQLTSSYLIGHREDVTLRLAHTVNTERYVWCRRRIYSLTSPRVHALLRVLRLLAALS